jgi:hypothetical protein
MSHCTALYDACVLYPAPLRSFLMYLAVTDVYRARWEQRYSRRVDAKRRKGSPDITRAQVEKIRDLMNAHVRDCLVTGYQSLIPSLTLPDPGDCHVLAAAICCGADVIVTANLKHFPAEALKPYGIDAQHPDEFLTHQLDLAPNIVCAAAKTHRASLKKPPMTADEFLAALERQGLPQTVSELRKFADLI